MFFEGHSLGFEMQDNVSEALQMLPFMRAGVGSHVVPRRDEEDDVQGRRAVRCGACLIRRRCAPTAGSARMAEVSERSIPSRS